MQSPLRGRQHRGAIASNAARAIDRGEEIEANRNELERVFALIPTAPKGRFA